MSLLDLFDDSWHDSQYNSTVFYIFIREGIMLEKAVLQKLSSIIDQQTGKDIVSAGIVGPIVVKGNRVGCSLQVAVQDGAVQEALRQACEKAIMQIAEVEYATVVLTAQRKSAKKTSLKKPVLSTSSEKQCVAGVKKIILVASGKGGVGKSTVSVALARALSASEYRIGLVDADIYGPSLPTMMGVSSNLVLKERAQITPIKKDGIYMVSMGCLVAEEQALIWRGAMVNKALYQLLLGTIWPNIDCLIVDMPPGTGDIQLSLAKYFAIETAILVSTPQNVALNDVKKAKNMFDKLHIPVLGIVENMSYAAIEGKKHYLFGRGHVERYAMQEHMLFLGEIPLHEDIAMSGDKGKSFSPSLMPEKMIESLINILQ